MRIIVFSATVALLLSGLVLADEPALNTGVLLKDGGGAINLSYDTNPACVDWNNDGLRDLLVGEFTYGHITLYLNSGTNLNPQFTSGTKIQSGGSPITVTYG